MWGSGEAFETTSGAKVKSEKMFDLHLKSHLLHKKSAIVSLLTLVSQMLGRVWAQKTRNLSLE